MGSGVLTRYNASAGSGKTYKLTSIFLTRLFSSAFSYKKILAVTFTNKAAAEMKRKILSQLSSLASGEKNEMLDSLAGTTGKTREEIITAAKQVLHSILHDFSFFNVCTIDSFFQKILKAFTREIGLNHGYIVELDHSVILQQAVNEMFSATTTDQSLGKWITDYSYERTEAGKSWNLRDDILRLSGEIFSENFRLMTPSEKDKLKDREFLGVYIKELKDIQSGFIERLKSSASECSEILRKFGVEDNMFFRGERGGVPSFLKMISESGQGVFRPATSTVSQVLDSPPVWTSKAGPTPNLLAALENGFSDCFTSLLRYFNENLVRVNTAFLITENIYILGIFSNVLGQVHKITTAENRFLLSDAGELLWLIIKDDQTPFIYEKSGNAFDNFMIDEFQDTSHIQWNNFWPLIENSLAEGNDSLVVGDVKQSIYRWRNSDWKILNSVLDEKVRKPGLHDEYLDTNWRSRKNIIGFNNALFTVLPRLIDKSEKNKTGKYVLEELYKGAGQKSPGKNEGGMVRLEFLEENGHSFQEEALERLPGVIEGLQDQGYSGSDIGILVRTNNEGAKVLNKIIDYRESVEKGKKARYNYNIISSESLLLSESPSVSFIIALLRSLYEENNELNRCIMLRNWMLITGQDPYSADLTEPEAEAARLFPENYSYFLRLVPKMTTFEAVEKTILFFGLGKLNGNTAYLSSLQDTVHEFSANYTSDIPLFLEWWDTTGYKKSVVVSDQPDSMRVLTIHKSKGLEFKAVIIPFISWNTGHGSKGPTIWARPGTDPFNKIGLVPLRYKSDMQFSEFAEEYFNESYHSVVDNINLLYVAFTRASDMLLGFCPVTPRPGSVSSLLREALSADDPILIKGSGTDMHRFLNEEGNLFLLGETGEKSEKHAGFPPGRITTGGYFVNKGVNRLRLKFNSENWLEKREGERSKRKNYGLLMHEILGSVHTVNDVNEAVDAMLRRGRITGQERNEIAERISRLISAPLVAGWFAPGQEVMNEADILCEDGTSLRPDRVLIGDNKITVIDFKFGKPLKGHNKQVLEYMKLIEKIELLPAEGFLWYIDENIILKV